MKNIIKKVYSLIMLAFLVFIPLFTSTVAYSGQWSGVDESVVEKFAEEAGRPPRDPYINTDQGDILLFVFLIAGVFGGFMAGYYFRTLFPPKNSVRE